MLLEKMAPIDLVDVRLPQPSTLKKKNALSVKHDKAKCNQTKQDLLVISFVGRKS